MSFEAIRWAYEQEVRSPLTKAILVNLCYRANDKTGICWPSLDQIAKDVGSSRSVVCRHIAELKRLGLISVEKHKGSSGWLSSTYAVKASCLSSNDLVTEKQRPSDCGATRVVTEKQTNLNPNLKSNLRATKVERSRIRSGEEPEKLQNIIDIPTLPPSFQLWKDMALGGRRR